MFAIACAWPPLLVPTAADLLILVLHRLGFSLLQLLVFMGVLGFALGLLLPPITSH